MRKKIALSMLMILLIASISCLSNPQNVQAAGTYNSSAALNYAAGHWNNGVGLCAEFVSECLNAGGASVYSKRATVLFEQLKSSGMGQVYEIKLCSDQSIYMPDYSGKIAAGDPVFYYCPSCDDGKAYQIHTVLCNGADSNGYMKAYSHNNANSGQTKYKYRTTCYDCNRRITTAYVYHFNNNHFPNACVDRITGGEKSIRVQGWAFDEDVSSKSVELHVYVGGPAGAANVEGYRIFANKYRADVNKVYGHGDYHGFDETISVNKTGTQEVYIYLIDANSGEPLLFDHYSVYIKKENKINFPSGTFTLNEGETKTLSFTFQGDGIHALSGSQSNGNISSKWAGVDWSTPKANLSIKGIQAGTTTLEIWFLDTNSNTFFKDSITVKVNHVHKYTTARITKQPTCTTNGTRSYVCSCGAVSTKTESIPAMGHTIVNDAAVAATCTTDGKTAGSHCSVCKAVIVQQKTVAATGHKGGTATCTKKAKCSVCGANYGSYAGHNYSTQWTIDKQATCTTTGSKSYHCINCGTQKNVTVIPATGHTGGTPTCVSQAKCVNCGEYYGGVTSHEYGVDGQCVYCNKHSSSQNNPDDSSSGDINSGENTQEKDNVDVNTDSETNDEKKSDSSGDVQIYEAEIGDILENEITGECYEVTDDSPRNATVEYLGTEEDVITAIIPDTVVLGGVTYQVTSIAEAAFEGNAKIRKVVIGKNVTEIGAEAFSRCKNLTTVSMGSNVTKIADRAFYNCSKLTKITIPDKVNKIGKYAFYGCRKLQSITINTSKLTSGKVGTKAFKYIHAKAKITVPKGKVGAYKKLLKSKGAGSRIVVKE